MNPNRRRERRRALLRNPNQSISHAADVLEPRALLSASAIATASSVAALSGSGSSSTKIAEQLKSPAASETAPAPSERE